MLLKLLSWLLTDSDVFALKPALAVPVLLVIACFAGVVSTDELNLDVGPSSSFIPASAP